RRRIRFERSLLHRGTGRRTARPVRPARNRQQAVLKPRRGGAPPHRADGASCLARHLLRLTEGWKGFAPVNGSGFSTMTNATYVDAMLGGLFVLVIACVLCAYAIRTLTVGRAIDARVARESGTVLLGRFPIEAIHWAGRGAGFFFVRHRVSPDALTLTSLVITAASGPLAATGHHLLAGCVFVFGAAFDALDGIVARARGLASPAGEVLDAIVDRYADAAPLFGLALYFRHSVWALSLVLAAIVGSMMVSYVRAKHEGLGLELPGWIMR